MADSGALPRQGHTPNNNSRWLSTPRAPVGDRNQLSEDKATFELAQSSKESAWCWRSQRTWSYSQKHLVDRQRRLHSAPADLRGASPPAPLADLTEQDSAIISSHVVKPKVEIMTMCIVIIAQYPVSL